MNKSELKRSLALAIKTAREAVAQLKMSEKKYRKVKKDLRRDVKIRADYLLERLILSRLLKNTNYAIISEETGKKPGKVGDLCWIVDPLDGSLNFSRGLPMYCISISLWNGNRPLLGMIYDFLKDEIFTGIVGDGVQLNGKAVRVSSVKEKSKAILCTGFPSSADFSKRSISNFVEDIKRYKKVRLFGSAALSLAYVACGRADVYYESGIKIWDVAAGIALVKAAGGKVILTPLNEEHSFIVKAGNPRLVK